jgi:hypothetical protein
MAKSLLSSKRSSMMRRRRDKPDVPRAFGGSGNSVTQYGGKRQLFKIVRPGLVRSLGKAASDQGYALTFSLDDAVSYSDFTTLFDEYRITRADITFWWQPGTSSVQFPHMCTAIDYDGATAPGAYTDLFQYSSTHIAMFNTANTIHNVSVKNPGVSLSTFSGNAAPVRSPWIDCSNVSQVHYGLLLFVGEYNSTTASGAISYHVRYHLEFRTTR